MNLDGVQLLSQDQLPPVLRLFIDPSLKYSKHKHTVETSRDCVHHTYTLVLTREPSTQPDEYIHLKLAPTTSTDISTQLSSAREMMSKSSLSETSPKTDNWSFTEKKMDSIYYTIPMKTDPVSFQKNNPSEKTTKPTSSGSSSVSTSATSTVSSSQTSSVPSSSLPTFDPNYEKIPRKVVTMVHVKFILVHRDTFKRRVQSTFTDEFQSDCRLEDVIVNFQQLCARQLRDARLQPRLSYCIGEISGKNSKPVLSSDLGKTLTQLAASKNVFQFALIVDNFDNS
ncbi:Protein CBG10162 [Caenorhabditis briggsae]|uniref:Protein CBG10162 n=2 Tax=Caenorhabditis briggsae TaxID=6238 RepID=A8XAI6_CAEBR|nr:Protein CBG10162 [Caenorhabditis briggsae]ULU02129.1 hypothetical protein L3Y34_002001 [Caenorhabditis briggsae]CAP29654.1 Protein CBG10162 [Caenorhabditis briggsae]